MIREILRKFPEVYNVVRFFHVLISNIINIPNRIRIGFATKKYISRIKPLNNRRIWYFCIPLHNNLGDYAQYICIKKWISTNYSMCECIEIPSDPIGHDYFNIINILKKKIVKDDLIIFQSGYTSSDLHSDEKIHRLIAEEFTENVIIFFPQTVKYSTPNQGRKTADIYNAHKKILFLSRDMKSYKLSVELFSQIRVLLFPDIVTSLIGIDFLSKKEDRKGLLLCLRNDSEKKYSDSLIKKVLSPIFEEKNIQWCDTTLSKRVKCSEEIILEYIRQFSRKEIIVTDRFHGTIFSLISGTPVVVLKTADHKVTEGAQWFLDKFPDYIRVANTPDDICRCVKELQMINHTGILPPVFKEEYYDKLKKIIQEMR